jgi:hypothetical protein
VHRDLALRCSHLDLTLDGCAFTPAIIHNA